MTFLQKVLNKNYKWYYIAKYSSKNSLASINMNIMYLIAGILEVSTYIYLYYINKSIDFQSVISQFIILRLYTSLIMNRWFYFTGDLIYSTGITKFLLVPTNYFMYNFSLSVGGRLVRNCLALASSLIIWLGVNVLLQPVSFGSNIFSLLVFLPFGFVLNFVICMVIGHLAFFIKDRRDYNAFTEIYYIIFGVFSGSIIPLSLIPYQWLQYTPFAYISFQPANFYYNPSWNNLVWIISVTSFWIVIMLLLYRFVFRIGLKKNEAVGL
jgi:ABC-type uncharacterized transport system permease subunit